MAFRLRDFVFYPPQIHAYHKRLRESQYWSPQQRRADTQEKLARLLHHAVSRVPHYRRTLAPYQSRFANMVERLDLSELPILTKQQIREHGQELWAENYAEYRPSVTQTSGTTGTPTKFLVDRQSHVVHFASIWNMLNWVGYRFGDRFADLTGGERAGEPIYARDLRLNCLRMCSSHLSHENVRDFANRLRRFEPVVFKGIPSSMYIYCRWLEESGIAPYQPTAILTCAETLHEHYRSKLKELFDCRLFDFYNQNERACLFSTCEHGRYHIHEDYSFVELVGADAPGRAQVVTTTTNNFAMPLIRYQTNDLVEIGDGSDCPCGRSYPTVKSVKGRMDDVVVTPDGRFHNSFEFIFERMDHIRMTQIVQDDVDRIDVRIVPTPAFDQRADTRRLEDELRAWLGSEIAIDFSFHTALQPGRTGKIPFVISLPGRELLRPAAV